MTHEEEVDRIIDSLLDEIWVFAYKQKDHNSNVEHLVKIDDIGNIISKSLCDKFMTGNIIIRHAVKQNTFSITTRFICEKCLSKLQSNLNKYGFSSIEASTSYEDSIDYIKFNRMQ